MFITQPLLEQVVPVGLAPPSHRYWRGVTLSLETPWYLCVVGSKGNVSAETALVAWESELLKLIGAQTPNKPVTAIGRMDKSKHETGRWELRWLDALWESTMSERDHVGRLVLRFEGEPQPMDELLNEVTRDDTRHLIFSSQT